MKAIIFTQKGKRKKEKGEPFYISQSIMFGLVKKIRMVKTNISTYLHP